MNVISTLKKTSTSQLIQTQQALQRELKRRTDLAESLSSTLLLSELPLRVTTRSTLLRDYRELTQNGGNLEKELTLKKLLLDLPPSYWNQFKAISPKGFNEFRAELSKNRINIDLFSTPVFRPTQEG